MLIKRLLHRWVLMEGEGAEGGAPAGGAAPAGNDGAAGAPAASDGSAAASSSQAATATATGSDAAGGEATKSALEALQPPASLVGDAAEQPAEGEAPKDGEQPKEKPADAAEEKPVEYADFTLPEGMSLEETALASFKEAAAGAKLTQEQAQAFVDMHAAAIQKAATAPYEQWRDTQKAWQDEIKADPEFGGAHLEKETIPAIARAIKAFSPNAEAEKALRQAFHFTGAGNHPEMIRFMARIGKAMSEGSHVAGTPTSGDGGKSAAQKLYPTQGGSTAQS